MYTKADTIAIITTPLTTPPAMAPVEGDEDEAEPCPLLLLAVGDVDADADVEFIVNLGMVESISYTCIKGISYSLILLGFEPKVSLSRCIQFYDKQTSK